jgi:hypothetical protein
MKPSEIYTEISEQLDKLDLSFSQKLEVRNIISDVLNKSISKDIENLKNKLETFHL